MSKFLNYLPARLMEGESTWYIIFYQEKVKAKKGEQMKRFRKTFKMNRIPDIYQRRVYASQKVKQINKVLKTGEPYRDPTTIIKKKKDIKDTPILEAMAIAEKIKCNTDRKRTIDMVISMCKIFAEFIEQRGYKKMAINKFGRKYAMQFLDYGVMQRNIGSRTYNNYIERMKAIMNELVAREYMDENPFSRMAKKKITGKKRRAFNETERQVVGEYIKEHDRWLWLGVLLQYHCFIRPIEQRRLRIFMIDLREGVIRMPADITKNKEAAIVTIPNSILEFLRDFGLHKFHQRAFLFGAGGKPHLRKCAGHNTYNLRHKKILEKLYKSGALSDIEGLSYYSWKDTGAMELFKKKVNILEIMRQLRHKDLSTTQKYCNSLYAINWEIKQLDNSIC